MKLAGIRLELKPDMVFGAVLDIVHWLPASIVRQQEAEVTDVVGCLSCVVVQVS